MRRALQPFAFADSVNSLWSAYGPRDPAGFVTYWVSELAFEHLRTLVDPDERLELQVAYAERFPGGEFAEAFAAITCQAKDGDEAEGCWSEFASTYPNSLYGP